MLMLSRAAISLALVDPHMVDVIKNAQEVARLK
jgi:hypothetical protein